MSIILDRHLNKVLLGRGRLAQMGEHLPTNRAIQVWLSRWVISSAPWQEKCVISIWISLTDAIYWRKVDIILSVWVEGKMQPDKIVPMTIMPTAYIQLCYSATNFSKPWHRLTCVHPYRGQADQRRDWSVAKDEKSLVRDTVPKMSLHCQSNWLNIYENISGPMAKTIEVCGIIEGLIQDAHFTTFVWPGIDGHTT